MAGPSELGIYAYKSLAYETSSERFCRVKDVGADRFGVVARKIYVEGKRDVNGRSIYLNICIEGLSESESKAFEASYRRDDLIGDVHFWHGISRHYREDGDDFDMDWQALQESVEQMIKQPVPVGIHFSEPLIYGRPSSPESPMVRNKNLLIGLIIVFAILLIGCALHECVGRYGTPSPEPSPKPLPPTPSPEPSPKPLPPTQSPEPSPKPLPPTQSPGPSPKPLPPTPSPEPSPKPLPPTPSPGPSPTAAPEQPPSGGQSQAPAPIKTSLKGLETGERASISIEVDTSVSRPES